MGGVSGRSVQSIAVTRPCLLLFIQMQRRCRRGVWIKLLALYLGSWVRSRVSTAPQVNIQHVFYLYDTIC